MKSITQFAVIKGLCLVAALGAVSAHAAPLWNEAANGDLSNNWLAPTPLTLSAGSNIILGTTGNGGQGVDRDYFTFTLAGGMSLTGLQLLSNTSVSGGSSFIGFQTGAQMVSPSTALPQDLLGFAHYSNDQINTDILPVIVGSLSSGTYSVWIQDTGGPASYGFDFQVTSVPLPGAAGFLLSGLLGLATLRKSRQC